MNPIDQSLRRLFQAAAQAPPPPAETAPFGFESRVLAQWRAQPREDYFALARLFRRAVICAALVMVASIIWSRQGNASASASVVALANYEINTQLPP